MNRRELLKTTLLTPGLLALGRRGNGQTTGLTVRPIRDGFHMPAGAAGNIIVLDTKEGLPAVDSGLSNSADLVVAKTKSVADGPLAILISAHWHNDLKGGDS